MRDQTVGPADALSLALAEPDQHVRRRWILGLTLASLGMWMAAQTPLQVVLALQLPFAMFPLLHFTSSHKRMGKWKNGWFLLAAGWSSAILITAMDIWGLPDSLSQAWKVITGA